MKKIRTFIKVTALSLLLLSNGIQSKAQTWDTLPYLTHGINARNFINYNDTLVIVGNFYVIPPFTGSKFVVGWDSLNYHLFSDNLSTWDGGGSVLGIYNKRLYLGGSFGQYTNPNEINKLAVWNGTEWEKFGNAIMGAGKINQFKVYRDTLYIGGDYGININGINDGYLVKWNDTAFYTCATYGCASFGTHPTGIEVYNDVLYAGLYSCFAVGGGQYVCNLGKYSGQAWSNVYDKNGNLFSSCVNSMLTDTINNDLYIACISIYRYDGEFFHHIGGAGSQVNTHAMCMYHGDLYIGGMFHTIDEIPALRLAKWNGEEWSEVGGGTNNAVEALYVYKDELYIGGYFSQVGGYLPANGVARYHEPEIEDCHWFRPRIQTQGYQDTFYITQSQPQVFVNFVNNNAYAQSWEWDFGDGFTGSGSKDIQHGYYLPGEYNVKVEVTQNGCTKTAERTIVIENYTGNKENKIENNDISIYPNPANNILTICLPPNINTAIASISDLSGKNYGFYDLNTNKTEIDISNLKSAKYFLQVKFKDKIENFGFIKE